MAKLQSQFQKFHEKIKVESDDLRKKRDIIHKRIKRSLSENGKPIPEILNQGSYIYGTGIKPAAGDDYDIDIGLIFNIKSAEYKPEEVRGWVFSAIKGHTDQVEDKGPCIRVKYEAGYHVDLVCYAKYEDNEQFESFHLAHKNGSWMLSDPKKIKEHVKTAREKFRDTKDSSGSDQLQRAVRYLKRWNDLIFSRPSDDKPIGLALLLYCVEILESPVYDSQGHPDDLQALLNISEKAKNSGKIRAYKPDTLEDVFEKISKNGMNNLISKFRLLYNSLKKAESSDDLESACKIMRALFGEDFPLDKSAPAMAGKNRKIAAERPWRRK